MLIRDWREKSRGNKPNCHSTHPPHQPPAPPPSTCAGDSAVRNCQPCSTARARRACSPGNGRTVKPTACGYITLRDLYKKSHWQVAGATFYQLHLLFDKHHDEQVELVDSIAERIQLLGGVSLAMAADVAETTRIERPPRGREEVPVQLSRLIDAHQVIVRQVRILARRAAQLGDD